MPVGLPSQDGQPVETIQFEYTGDGTDVELSSDPMTGTSDGQSMHADFWNTWDQAAFEQVVRNCVNPGGKFTNEECMSAGNGFGKPSGTGSPAPRPSSTTPSAPAVTPGTTGGTAPRPAA